MVDDIGRMIMRRIEALIAALGHVVTAEQKIEIERAILQTGRETISIVRKELKR